MNHSNSVSTRTSALFGLFPGFRAGLALVAIASALAFACNRTEQTQPAAQKTAPALPAVAGAERVLVTEDGFQPATVPLKQGEKLVFRRTTDDTCAKAVVFPALHIEKELPLNTDVTIELPSSATGEVGFQCGMGMYKSKVVVQ